MSGYIILGLIRHGGFLAPAERLPLEAVMTTMTADLPVRYERLKRGIHPSGHGLENVTTPLFIPCSMQE